jgi:hypothetical protein
MRALHTCDRPACVKQDHLYEGTPKDNMRDCIDRGRRPNTRNGSRRLSDDDVRTIRMLVGRGEKPYHVARDFGISYNMLWRVVNRVCYADVT